MFDYEKKHLEFLRAHLAECTVLLKQNGAFPLKKACRIAAYGSGVRHTVKGGTGSGEVNSRFFVNIEQGLEHAGFTLTTKSWLNAYDQQRELAKQQFIKEVKARAKAHHVYAVIEGMGAVMPEPEYDLPLEGDGEAAIYVLARTSGEGNDRSPQPGDIQLTATEVRDILALNQQYDAFMLVLNVGGAVDLSPVAEVKNILLLSQLGVETGNALADILLGKTNPSGKLSTTWSAWEDYADIGEFGASDDTRYREGIYVGYRYFDSVGKKALFPFGYGTSYTSFQIEPAEITVQKGQAQVKAVVKNTGRYAGKEVVQVYVSVPEGTLDQPYQMLAGFVKTSELAPGATEEVTVSFDFSQLASYDTAQAAYVLEKGDYIIRVGSSSVDTTVAAVAALEEDVVILWAQNSCGAPDFEDWKPEKRPVEGAATDVSRLVLNAADFVAATVSYEQEDAIDEAVSKLTDEQLAYLNVGAFDPKAKGLSIIGNAGFCVAGAAGETTSQLKNADFPVLVMADGPAGLRLSPQSYRDEKGVHAIGQGGLPESITAFLPGPIKLLLKLLAGRNASPKKGCEVIEQYATAIPIGTALAQSWNFQLAESCGDLVGDEMERFGVHLWLAPALNIHRSIRCGRNFEYFSEDPLLSGKMAAAITLGVQKHPGCGTTIKHYAANNQEYNRYNNNSMVSERAMREIYLKGFGICVKEAQPCAVMTSYNLLNGQHTSESRGLIEDILRSEYGYEGIVMTDWIVAGMMGKNAHYPAPQAHRIAAAGGDLVMPGGKADHANVLSGLAKGALSRQQLQVNATRVYRMAKRLNQGKRKIL